MNFVSDTVRGFMLAGEADGIEGGLFNVGSGIGQTIGEILDEIQSVVGSDKRVVTEPQRIRPNASEVKALVCDYSKAMAAFGYKPLVSLRTGLELVRDFVAERKAPRRLSEYRV